MVHVRAEAGVICLLYGTHTHNTYTPLWQARKYSLAGFVSACAGIKSDCLMHKSSLNAALDIATPTVTHPLLIQI